MTAEAVNTWFTPFHYFTYLGAILIALIGYLQWKWANNCSKNVLVLVQRSDGHGDFILAPQEGGSVTLKDPKSGDSKTWAINELATVDVPYPGIGFIPLFLQKTIQMIVVSESDWEPITNRSPYRKKVASPDVVELLKELKAELPVKGNPAVALVGRVNDVLENVAVAPTRELIADPSFLGNLLQSKVFKDLATVSKELTDSLKTVAGKLTKLVNPTIVYIGLGLIAALVVFALFKVLPLAEQVADMAKQLEKIREALGVQ